MSESPLTILPTDTRWPGPWHVEEGPECLCSRCGLAILEPEIAIRAWPDDANAYSYRFHPVCLGFQAYDPRDEDVEPDDPAWPPRPGEEDDEITRCPYCGEADCEASCTTALVQDNRTSEAEMPDLGPCCVCRQSGLQVRTILSLPFRAPVPGTGWGCVVCGLPPNGAVAVVCDGRLESPLQDVCYGFPGEGDRSAYAARNPEPFDHDQTRHAEDDAPQPCGHPWSAVVWLDDETGDCGACLKEEESLVPGPWSLATDEGQRTMDPSAEEETHAADDA